MVTDTLMLLKSVDEHVDAFKKGDLGTSMGSGYAPTLVNLVELVKTNVPSPNHHYHQHHWTNHQQYHDEHDIKR